MPDNVATPAMPAAPPSAPAPTTAAPPAAAAAASSTPAAVPAPAAAPPVAPAAAEPAKPAEAPKLMEPLIGGDGPPPDVPIDSRDLPAATEPAAYDLKLPEGIEVDAPRMEKAKAIFAKGKVSAETAQELASLYGEQLQEAGKAMANRQIEVWNETMVGWQKEVMADPKLGGANFPQSKHAIEEGLKTIFGITGTTPLNAPERAEHAQFLAALKIGGAGTNPPIFRFLHKVAAPRSEGRPVQGGQPAAPSKSYAQVMYPQKAAE